MSKDLKASVRLDTRNAISSLDALERKISNIEKAINKTNSTNSKLSSNLSKAVAPAKQVATETGKIDKNLKNSSSSASMLTSKLKRLASTYLGVMGAKALITTSDTITSAENRLNNLYGGDTKATQAAMDKMYTSAQKVRMAYTDMMSNVSKSMTLAGDAFGNNIDNAIRFQEIMSEAYTLGGASAAEMSSSMYQMMQALGSGILQGDELRSVREGAPLAYKEIEKFAQKTLNSKESLKELASQGLITSDMVVAAIMNAGDKMDEAFKDTDATFAQLWNNFKNTATRAFDPVFDSLRELGNSEEMAKALEIVANGLIIVGQVLAFVVDVFAAFFRWFVNNWYWIRFIVYAVILVMILNLMKLAAQAIITGITMFWHL